jgi:hypothetical protein
MPKKVEQYDAERKQVLDRMFEILGISESNKTICLNDIDKDEAKLKAIEELEIDIKKYFLTGLWSAYKGKRIKRRYFSLLRSLLKEFNIIYKTKTIRETVFEGDKSKTTNKLIVIIEI